MVLEPAKPKQSRRAAANWRQRPDWHPFDEIFKKTEKRERRRRGWRRVIEAVLDVLEALPF